MRSLVLSVGTAAVVVQGAGGLAQTVLPGIDCTADPPRETAYFEWPVRNPSVWNRTYNVFQNCDDEIVEMLKDKGTLRYPYHTGVDLALKEGETGGQPVLAAGSGIVLYAGSHPTLANGAVVMIRHLAPSGSPYLIAEHKGNVTYPPHYGQVQSELLSYRKVKAFEAVTVYLHLDSARLLVKKGAVVDGGKEIGRLYTRADHVSRKYTYPPHLHFEVWRHCTDNFRNGYDEPQEFPGRQLIDPTAFVLAHRPPIRTESVTVRAGEVVIEFPIDLGRPWKWVAVGGLEYTWHMKVHVAGKDYEVGYYLFGPMGTGGPPGSGSLGDLLSICQLSAWELIPGGGGRTISGVSLSSEIDVGRGALVIRAKGGDLVRAIASEKPTSCQLVTVLAHEPANGATVSIQYEQ